MKVIKVQPISMPEAREVMEEREKEKELGYEQKLAAEHLKKFTKLSPADDKKFLKELGEILRMSPETTVQIANLMPKTADELRLIFAREKFSLKEDETTKILELVKKFS
jgi:DNA-directed RNA polymerase subunit F